MILSVELRRVWEIHQIISLPFLLFLGLFSSCLGVEVALQLPGRLLLLGGIVGDAGGLGQARACGTKEKK